MALKSLQDSARELDCCVETLRRLVRAGRIPCYEVGRTFRLDLAEVKKVLRRERIPTSTKERTT
jgi:excisionase family DNA binding protein